MLFWLFVGAAIILKSLLEKLKDIQVGIVLSAHESKHCLGNKKENCDGHAVKCGCDDCCTSINVIKFIK